MDSWLPQTTLVVSPRDEKEVAAHSRVLAWRSPGAAEPGGCRLHNRTKSDTRRRLSRAASPSLIPRGSPAAGSAGPGPLLAPAGRKQCCPGAPRRAAQCFRLEILGFPTNHSSPSEQINVSLPIDMICSH